MKVSHLLFIYLTYLKFENEEEEPQHLAGGVANHAYEIGVA
jgi:hypothetical protein